MCFALLSTKITHFREDFSVGRVRPGEPPEGALLRSAQRDASPYLLVAAPPRYVFRGLNCRIWGHERVSTGRSRVLATLAQPLPASGVKPALSRKYAVEIGEHTRPRVFRLAPRRSERGRSSVTER